MSFVRCNIFESNVTNSADVKFCINIRKFEGCMLSTIFQLIQTIPCLIQQSSLAIFLG